jgi:hypothetical protein
MVTVLVMPTFQPESRFLAEFHRLSVADQAAFRRAVALFHEGLIARQFHSSLRVKSYQSLPGVNEMTWARDGRALWRYGRPVRPGHAHIIWLRIGTHDIFER